MYARVSERPSPALEATDRDPAGSVIGVVQHGLHGENGSRRRVTLCSRVAAAAHQVIAGIARGPAREMPPVLDLGKHLDARLDRIGHVGLIYVDAHGGKHL